VLYGFGKKIDSKDTEDDKCNACNSKSIELLPMKHVTTNSDKDNAEPGPDSIGNTDRYSPKTNGEKEQAGTVKQQHAY